MNYSASRFLSGNARASNRIWRTAIVDAALGMFFFLASCTSKQIAGPHATVLMRDGTTMAGTVTATSTAEITLAGDDHATHTIAMTGVKSIEYDDAAPASAAAGTAPVTPAPASAGAPAPPPAPVHRTAARAASDAVHENHYHPTSAEIHTKTYELPVGTDIGVRTEETIDSAKAAENQTYAAEVTDDVVDSNGDVVIPHGSNAQIVIRSASKGGRFRGTSDLVLDLHSISVEGQEYVVSTTDLTKSGKQGFGANKRTAIFTGGGSAVGAIIGAIAGGGKGAAIGAGAGAGGGALTQVLTKGGSIRVPAETVLTFQLDRAVRIEQVK